MKKRIVAGMLALSLGMCAAACGGAAEETSAGEAEAVSTEPASGGEESPETEETAAQVTPEPEEAEEEEAEETEETEETEEELLAQAWNPEDYESDNLSIQFGSYEQDDNPDNGAEPLEWNIIKEEDGKVLLICKYGIEAMFYHTSEEDVTWETCSLRQWLNHDFIDKAFGEEKTDIQLSLLENNDGLMHEMSEGGNPTQDYVFLLSAEEFMENMDFDARTQMSAYAGKTADMVYVDDKPLARTWLRTPGAGKNAAAVVDIEGHLDDRGDYTWMALNAVRPVMWVTKTPEIAAQMAAYEELSIGSYVTLGHYEQNPNLDGLEPIEWQVLDRKDGKALLLSRYILEDYNSENGNIRDWLNNYFYNTAFDEEKEYIVEANLLYRESTEAENGKVISPEIRRVDSVFLLSKTEVETYFDGNETGGRATVGTAYAGGANSWLVRVSHKEYGVVFSDGGYRGTFGSKGTGIRPAIWVDMAVFQTELTAPEEQGYGDIDSVLHLVEGLEGNVTFGAYEQDGNLDNGREPIEWSILAREGDRMLLFSKYILDAKYYNETESQKEDIGWGDCTLRAWLNNEFYNAAFSEEEKQYIPLSKITSSLKYNTVTEETEDYVFLLSYDELKQYYDLEGGRYHDALICEKTEYATTQGLSSNRWLERCCVYKPITGGKGTVTTINGHGTHETSVSDTPGNGGIRPAIWINVN